ncbi:MAG TPA: TIGR02391 family protein [Streptosporangiaceae bacterium]|nr:TIGR02391 family protein [Streptosporangiaceae bacterium]
MTQTAAPPPAFSASVAEQVCKVLADAVTGSEIPNLIAVLKIAEPPGSQQATKWKRLFNAVAERQNRQGDGRPLLRLVTDVMAPVRFESPARFNEIRARLNERLLLSGYQVLEGGKLARAKPAATLSEAQRRADDLRSELSRRDVHSDVLLFCRAELLEQNYFHAVLEASKSVADKLRTLTGVTGDGTPLVDATCSMSSGPRVVFNDLVTEWERSEQTGIATLLKGLFSTFRNPAAHAPKVLWSTSRKDALDMLTLASMLHRRLDSATVRGPAASV